MTNTIVAGNTADGGCPDLRSTLISGGHNLIGDTTCGTGISNGVNPQPDIVNPAPLLGPLGNNGGTTQTVPLLLGSPALAHGDPAVCALPLPPAGSRRMARGGVDQRGLPRPAATCAIGAYEPQPAAIAATAGTVAADDGWHALRHQPCGERHRRSDESSARLVRHLHRAGSPAPAAPSRAARP